MDKIGIVGLGYVGLPLAVAFASKYQVIGFDINLDRIRELESGVDRTRELESSDIAAVKNQLSFSASLEDLASCSIFIVTVPTPIDVYKKPDLRPLMGASKTVGKVLKKGDTVIYESTVYPGCTEEDCVPILEAESGLIFNKDFFCGYSPERINPGDKVHTVTKIRKVTSGSTPEIADKVDTLYASVIEAGTFKASSIKVAEAAKVIENSQRDINIAFVNELSKIFGHMNIDTNEVLEAAGTKWNFLPFKPGLVGGHCIGVDPYYLTYKAEGLGYHPEIILAGRRINDGMALYVVSQIVKVCAKKGVKVQNANALVLGITFKENCPDIRNSKAPDIIKELVEFGVNVSVYDPLADAEEVRHEYGLSLIAQPEKDYDIIVHAVAHEAFATLNIPALAASQSVIYDVKSILKKDLVDARL